jgi:hypothetical protein
MVLPVSKLSHERLNWLIRLRASELREADCLSRYP